MTESWRRLCACAATRKRSSTRSSTGPGEPTCVPAHAPARTHARDVPALPSFHRPPPPIFLPHLFSFPSLPPTATKTLVLGGAGRAGTGTGLSSGSRQRSPSRQTALAYTTTVDHDRLPGPAVARPAAVRRAGRQVCALTQKSFTTVVDELKVSDVAVERFEHEGGPVRSSLLHAHSPIHGFNPSFPLRSAFF